jgi:hypothetical protein
MSDAHPMRPCAHANAPMQAPISVPTTYDENRKPMNASGSRAVAAPAAAAAAEEGAVDIRQAAIVSRDGGWGGGRGRGAPQPLIGHCCGCAAVSASFELA